MPTPPVLFIPGMGGSFNLSVLLDLRGKTLSGWNFPPFVDYGNTFLEAFRRAGYRRNRDLFVAFYDWRKAIDDSARDYLVPWIDRARKSSGSNTVVLVGHSMGGLVARSYIQSQGYRGDVERLITLGSPHRGSANAYPVWQGGELDWDPLMRTVLNVYLWYLEHLHPFQSGLDRLKTIRTQVPGARDLLPIDDYLLVQEQPPHFKPEASMNQRNLWGHLLNTEEAINTLITHVTLSTIIGEGFLSNQAIVVGDPPAPTDDPPRFPDGIPLRNMQTSQGDGTVLGLSARFDDSRVHNLPPTAIAHIDLPDKAVDLVLAELGITDVNVPAAPAREPRLLIMTASPLDITVEPPTTTTTPGVLGVPGEPIPTRQRPRTRTFTYGHSGKPLHLTVVERPALGTYQVRLHGTATGSFELGTLIVGAESPPQAGVLGISSETTTEGESLFATSAASVAGNVARETELFYQIDCVSLSETPRITFDAQATTRNLLARMRDVVQTSPPGVLGVAAEPAATQLQNTLTTAVGSEDLRRQLGTALSQDDVNTTTAVVSIVDTDQRPDLLALLNQVNKQVVGPRNPTIALGMAQQIEQIEQQQT